MIAKLGVVALACMFSLTRVNSVEIKNSYNFEKAFKSAAREIYFNNYEKFDDFINGPLEQMEEKREEFAPGFSTTDHFREVIAFRIAMRDVFDEMAILKPLAEQARNSAASPQEKEELESSIEEMHKENDLAFTWTCKNLLNATETYFEEAKIEQGKRAEFFLQVDKLIDNIIGCPDNRISKLNSCSDKTPEWEGRCNELKESGIFGRLAELSDYELE